MRKMRAIMAIGYGTAEVLKLQQVPKPSIKPNEVLVKVEAASFTRADVMMLTGKPYLSRLFVGVTQPKHPIPGTGFAGVVAETGSEVAQFKIGDAVFGETTLGFSTHAEFVAVPQEGVILPLPSGLSPSEAATWCDGPLTSINFLQELADIRPGQRVLINGASGSLGTAAVQIARYLGAEVTGVCSARNTGLVLSLGAHHVIDYAQTDFTQSDEAYDIIYDTVGKSSFTACRKALTPSGQYLSPVMKGRLLWDMLWTGINGKQKAKFAASGLKKAPELRTLLQTLIAIWQEGKLRAIIDRQYPLERAAEAHKHIAAGHKKGNVVLIIQE